MTRRDVFQAIADPNRRAIVGLLASGRLPLNSIAERFRISRPAVSKHIRILHECGLVEITRQGRERYCDVRFEKLNEVSNWVERYRKFWMARLDALEEYIENVQQEERKRG